jgi:hypothetical protein
VLDERKDLPPAVGDVIARALSKVPDERQQSAGELAEALAAAAATSDETGVIPAGAETTENENLSAGNTNRIVVPTAPFETRPTVSTEADEATIVHAREQVYVADEPELFDAPPPAASFNPWRIMIPAAVLLVALLGVFYAYQRNSDSSTTNDNSQLVIDPNASPVVPGASPTGAEEGNITPVTGTPTPLATPGQTSTGGTGTVGNPNPAPTPRRNPTPPPARTSPTPAPDDPPPPTPRATPPPDLSTPASDPPPRGNSLS